MMSHLSLGLFLLVLLAICQNALCASVSNENLNSVITDDAAEDLTDDDGTTGEPEIVTTLKPIPSIRMPASSDLKTESKYSKKKAFSENKEYYVGQVELWPPRLAYKSKNDILEARAACYPTEITLYLKFSTGFTGYVYPYHHFKRCHLFTGTGETDIKMVTDTTSCGMDVVYSISRNNVSFMEFTVMIQWDPEFIGQYDRKLRVTCNRPDNDKRPVTFNASNPLVRMTIEAASEDEADMDVPANDSFAISGYDSVRLGETVEVSIVLDSHGADETFDAQVIKCAAYDGLQDDERKIDTYSTQSNDGSFTYDGSKMLIADGCPVASAYFSAFVKKIAGNFVTLDSAFKIFRFPSSPYVFLSCDVRICRGECPPQQECTSKLKTEPATVSADHKVVTLFRPLLIKLGTLAGGSSMGGEDSVGRSKICQGLPTASFIAGLIGMGFVCAIVCVFMYRRFKRGTEKDYKMQYSPNADRNKDEVAPLKVTTGAASAD